MDTVRIELTVYFDDPFWVGVLQRDTGGMTEAVRLVFGAEPKDYEVYRLLLEQYVTLRFSPPVTGDERTVQTPNPKRMQRAVARQLEYTGIGTKAQQALKLQQEQRKMERKTRGKLERDAQEERKVQLRQAKRKQKHRGR
jgi:hypothetical protein